MSDTAAPAAWPLEESWSKRGSDLGVKKIIIRIITKKENSSNE